MKQEDGKGIGDPVHKYYFFPSEARDFSRGYFTGLLTTRPAGANCVKNMALKDQDIINSNR